MEKNNNEKKSFFKNKANIIIFTILAILGIAASIIIPRIAGGGQPNSGEYEPPLNIADPIPEGVRGTVVDEIWNGTTFNKAALQTLLNYLTPNGKFAEIGVNATTSIKASDLYSSNYNSKGANKTIIVTFGGIQWILTYLSQDINGNIIATLWQATTSTESKWANGYTSSAGASDKFPSNMYSTSYIRAVTLNNGGIYATSTTASTPATQSSTHTYAKFTMPSATGSVINYLVQPKYVSWQQHQSAKTQLGDSYNYPNDEWQSSDANYASNYDYGAFGTACSAYYSAWNEDYIWLPSATEIGEDVWFADGIWGTIDAERRMDTTSPWLRSGSYNDSSDSYCYVYYRAVFTNCSVTDSYSVRPALHLNLKAATSSVGLSESQISEAVITDVADQTYTGSALTPNPTITYNGTTLTKGTDYTLSYSNNTNVGEATITITGIGEYEGTREKTFKIVQAKNDWTITPKFSGTGVSGAGSSSNPYVIAKSLTPAKTAAAKFGTPTYQYKKATDADTAYSDSFPTKAGKYMMKTTVAATSNYGGLSTEIYFNITDTFGSDMLISLNKLTFEYTGSSVGINVNSVTYNGQTLAINTDYTIKYRTASSSTLTTTAPSAIGSYYIVIIGTGLYSGNGYAPFEIVKAKVTIPTITTPWLEYNGAEQTISATYDSNRVTASGLSGTNAGEYTATFTLTDTTHYEWQDGTTTAKTLNWLIAKKTIPKPTVKSSVRFVYTGYEHEIKPEHLNNWIDGVMVITGGNKFTNVGKYTLQVALTTEGAKNYVWKE